MKVCRLAEVATIDSGAGFPLQYQGTQDETFPFLKVSDMNLAGNERAIRTWNNSISEEVRVKLRAKAFPAGAIIFPKIGAAIGTNKKRQLTQPSCVDNNVMGVIPKPELLDSEYLYYQFLAKNISDFASDSNPPSIRKSDVENWMIRVPPLHEQRRMVDILTRAEGIVRLRREAEKKAAELIPALFLDMFGDPATNPKGWPVVRLADVCGKCATKDPKKQPGEEFTYIDIAAIDTERGQVSETKTLLGTDAPSRARQVVQAGDVIVSTVRPNLRGSAWIPEDFDGQVCSTGFCVLRPSSKTTTAFIYAVVRSDWFVSELMKHVRGAQYPAVSDKDIFGVQIPLPSLSAQQDFSDRLNAMRSIQSQQTDATAKAQATFDALLAQAFRA